MNNTPRQILLYEAFNYPLPAFAHMPLTLGQDRARLSKRHGATSVMAYREMGYLPQALNNFVVRLGWSCGDQEIFSAEEMVQKFSLENVGKSAGIFNAEKLNWLNAHYIKQETDEHLAQLVIPLLAKKGYALDGSLDLVKMVKGFKERSKTLEEMAEKAAFYFKDTLEYDPEDTLIVFTGDNGFLFGEHGLIDKRVAYEESIRVPMLAHCPDAIRPGTEVERLVLNLDLAPTLLDAGGVRAPEAMDGRSFLPLARGEAVPWRESFVYTYYWERNFPHTPTVHALRGERYKLVRCHGLWDTDELYDLVEDPHETHYLVRDPAHRARVQELRAALFAELERTGGLQMPLWPDVGGASDLRSRTGAARR